MKRVYGFTLVELMVTVVVAAILLGIGVPSFRTLMANNRATTQANALFSALNYARSEAIARAGTVTVCPKNSNVVTDTICGGNAKWVNGWHVFTDAGVVGTFDGTDTVLKHWDSLPGTPTITTTEAYIGFGSNGAKNSTSTGNVTVVMSESGTGGDASRCVRVAEMGAVRVHKITNTATCP